MKQLKPASHAVRRTLVIHRETIVELTADRLRQVAGGDDNGEITISKLIGCLARPPGDR